jgi:hypothetical protein
MMRRFEIDIEYTLQLPFINLLLYLLFETHVKSTSRSKMVLAHSFTIPCHFTKTIIRMTTCYPSSKFMPFLPRHQTAVMLTKPQTVCV